MLGSSLICLGGMALVGSSIATPTQARPYVEQRAVSSPCVAMASAQASAIAANPGSSTYTIPARAAYQCISEVPVQKDFSIRLINSLKAWLEIHSTIDYLQYPPSGFLWPSIDYHKELDRILGNVNNDTYYSQYDVEIDIDSLLLHSHDFHAVYRGTLSRTVYYDRGFNLVSVSADGIAIPQVYVASDYVTADLDGNQYLTMTSNTSPIDSINGMSVQDFLQTQALVAYSHDPDSMYNQAVRSLAQSFNIGEPSIDVFQQPKYYPGETTTIKFKNGTTSNVPTNAITTCKTGTIVTGEDYWNQCGNVILPDTSTGGSKRARMKRDLNLPDEQHFRAKFPKLRNRQSSDTISQIPAFPEPIAIDVDGILSGYYLDAGNSSATEDVAVLVIRSFQGQDPKFMISFQDALQSFLQQATKAKKTKLIIDIQGNGGGYIDLATELLAQLFPNSPPDQKSDMRESVGYGLVLKKAGELLATADDEKKPNVTQALINESQMSPFAWQSVMKQDGAEFISFTDFYGPNVHGHGTFTSFFQCNYTNTDPSDFTAARISITGFGPERPVAKNTPPPFKPENIVLLSDGFCGSTCSSVFEMFTNLHQIPSIVIGGRPGTGPMQAVGNSKGAQVFQSPAFGQIIGWWEDDSTGVAIDKSKAKGTVFQDWDSFATDNGLIAVNARNGYRLGDETSTPLLFVYQAADCRFWTTPAMLADPTAIWERTAEIAFDPTRKTFGAAGGPYISKYCVSGSTGHSTSVTGGLRKGELGEQKALPANAKPQYPLGWLQNGNQIVQQFSLARTNGNGAGEANTLAGDQTTGKGNSTDSDEDGSLSPQDLETGLSNLAKFCAGFNGNEWLMTLVCSALGS